MNGNVPYPSYSPNTVNQTVSIGGYTFKGQPGQGWTIQQTPEQQQQQQAQQQYQAAVGSAVSGLQAQGTSLDTQYNTLLADILGQGTVAMNTATTGENNLLAQRGITNNSPLYSQQMTQAQLPVSQANQAAVGNLGYTQAQLKNSLASEIANLQAGGAGTVAELPLSYGSLALAQSILPSQIALNSAQAYNYQNQLANNIALQQLRNQYQIVPAGQSLVNTLANFAVNPGMLTQNTGAAWLNNGQ